MRTIAALYVDPRGVYSDLPGVEVWDEERDARKYPGPHPVVAHPPCKRWGRYWHGGPSARVRQRLGADGGCFASAVAAVRRWGGVLEHPEASHAWRRFEINTPPRGGGWVSSGLFDGGWTCCVEQGHYGHRARKATWLYAVGCALPALRWGPSHASIRMDLGFHSAEESAAAMAEARYMPNERMGKRERMATPLPFRDLLISMARSAHPLDPNTDEGQHGR